MAEWTADLWPIADEDDITLQHLNDLRAMLNYHTGQTAIASAFTDGYSVWNAINDVRAAVGTYAKYSGSSDTGALWQNDTDDTLGSEDDYSPDGRSARDNIFAQTFTPTTRRIWTNQYDGDEVVGSHSIPEQCSFGNSTVDLRFLNELYSIIEALRWQEALPDKTAAYNGKAKSYYNSGAQATAALALSVGWTGWSALVEADAATYTQMGLGFFDAYFHCQAHRSGANYDANYSEQRTQGRIWIPADTVEIKLAPFQWMNTWWDVTASASKKLPEQVLAELYMDTTQSIKWDASDYTFAGDAILPDTHMGTQTNKLVIGGTSLASGAWTAGAWNYYQYRFKWQLMEDLKDAFEDGHYWTANAYGFFNDYPFRLLCKLTDV